MGSDKNKKKTGKSNSHRHVYCKKKGACRKLATSVQLPSEDDRGETSRSAVEGSRIINLSQLQLYIDDLSKHSSDCGGSIILCGETRNGLASILESKCSSCQETIAFETSEKVKGPKGYCR